MNELTKIESTRYLELKKKIKHWVDDRFTMGLALSEIQEKKLYRQDYDTFEEFCVAEYNFQKSQAYRMIEAAQVKESMKMSPIGDKLINEGQARALASVPEKDRERVMKQAIEHGPITAKSISKAAEHIQDAIQLDKEGYPIPKEIQEDWNKAQGANHLLSKVSEVKCALQAAKDSDDILFVEVLQSTIADLKNAYTGLKGAIPYGVCSCEGHGRKKCTLCKGRGFLSQFRYEQCVPAEIKSIRKKSRAKVAA